MGKGSVSVKGNGSVRLRGERGHKCEEHKASFVDDTQHV